MNPSSNEADPGGSGLYVITLAASAMPMALDVPFRYELTGFTVFRSRSFKGGRESFQLHLGYFETARDAEDALTVARKYYPEAWIAAAPKANLGSLDNTLNTEFRLLRTAYARVVRPGSAAPTSAPVEATPADGERAAWPGVPSPQHYAVQLEWSRAPIVAANVPRLAIFEGFHLYAVRLLREGSPRHCLRLGFFNDVDAGRQVAEHVRPRFPGVGVVPVSYREYSRAMELARQRALRAVARETASGATATAPTAAPVPAAPSQKAGTGEGIPSRGQFIVRQLARGFLPWRRRRDGRDRHDG